LRYDTFGASALYLSTRSTEEIRFIFPVPLKITNFSYKHYLLK